MDWRSACFPSLISAVEAYDGVTMSNVNQQNIALVSIVVAARPLRSMPSTQA
jgi:hypothetical protein